MQGPDGVRLWIEGNVIIDHWVDQPTTEWSGTATLEAGKSYSLVLEYYENVNTASATLQWSIVNQKFLFQ